MGILNSFPGVVAYHRPVLVTGPFSAPFPITSTLASFSESEPAQGLRKRVLIRSVYSFNLESEFRIIQSVIRRYPYISMDTEFPGIIYRHVQGTPTQFSDRFSLVYHFLRMNVNALKLIQVGLTFSDADGNLPDLGLGLPCCFIWEFNFRFDLSSDLYNSNSIQLLRNSGIDFERSYLYGIDSTLFGRCLIEYGLVFNRSVRWVTFHGAYDFAFLIRLLCRDQLPEKRTVFLTLLRTYFGDLVYDVKHMMGFTGNLYGGLERLAKMLGVERVAGSSHQAASDSLLTWHAFLRLKQIYFDGEEQHSGVLYGV